MYVTIKHTRKNYEIQTAVFLALILYIFSVFKTVKQELNEILASSKLSLLMNTFTSTSLTVRGGTETRENTLQVLGGFSLSYWLRQ